MPPSITRERNSMYVTTWRIARPGLVDQIMNATPFWLVLKQKGCMESQTGGAFIEQGLSYKKNETIRFIGRGQPVEIQVTDPLTTAHWDWKYLTGHITLFNADWQKNRGKAARMKRVKTDIDNLQASAIDDMETYLFGDGTADDGEAINGLGNLVPSDPTTGTVGNLNRATYNWWRSQYTDMSGLEVSVHLLDKMRTMHNTCGQKSGGLNRFPDLWVTTQTVHEYYESEVAEVARVLIDNKALADLGFGDLSFKGKPIVWSPNCTSGAMFALNTAFIQFVYDPGQYFDLGDEIPIYNQPGDAVMHLLTACNLTMSNLSRHGKLFSIGS